MAKKNDPTDGFDEVLKHIETLPDIKNKLAYLIVEKTRWDQENADFWTGLGIRSFSEKCELEISKYKELAKFEGRNNDKAKELLKGLDRSPLTRKAVGPRPWGVPDAAGYMTVGERHYSEWMGEEGNATPKEADRPNQFTRKQAIYLLQELIPEFKTADNTRKAEFITKLTGYTSTKNIADEFSNIRNFEDPQLLEEWKGKFKHSGRGRKKIIPS
ncbi:MAG: hypothetical protein H0V90_09470 [Blastocatellia bacterium]|nr:hypothetical protein [Blastocatellia bacterium]